MTAREVAKREEMATMNKTTCIKQTDKVSTRAKRWLHPLVIATDRGPSPRHDHAEHCRCATTIRGYFCFHFGLAKCLSGHLPAWATLSRCSSLLLPNSMSRTRTSGAMKAMAACCACTRILCTLPPPCRLPTMQATEPFRRIGWFCAWPQQGVLDIRFICSWIS